MGTVPNDISRVPLQQRLLGCSLSQKPQFLFADPATLDKRDGVNMGYLCMVVVFRCDKLDVAF